MALAFTSSALDIEKWQTSMTKVAPIAAGMNIPLEETAAIMGTLTDAGIEASIAGTSMRNIFLQMKDPASDLSKFLGFTVKNADDLSKAMTLLKTANDDTLDGLVKTRQVASFNVMVKGAERVGTLTKALKEANGAAADMAAIVADTLEGSFKRLTSASEGLAIELTEKLGGGMQGIVDKLAIFLNKMTDSSEGLATMITNFVALIKVVGLYKIGIGLAAIGTRAFNASLVITRASLIKTGFGAVAVLLGTVAEKLYLSGDAADYAAKNMNKLTTEKERQVIEEEHILELMNRQFSENLEQSKTNINLLDLQVKGRKNLRAALLKEIEQDKVKNKLSKGQSELEKQNLKQIELIDNAIGRLQENIERRNNNQIKIIDLSNEEIKVSKSLIVLKEEELAVIRRMPEHTEKQIASKNRLIQITNIEIKRLKNLGIAKDEDIDKDEKLSESDESLNAKRITNNQIQVGLQRKLIAGKITQQEFDETFTQTQILNMENLLAHEVFTNEERINLTKKLNDLKLNLLSLEEKARQDIATKTKMDLDEENRKRQESIDGVNMLGSSLVSMAGDDKKMQGIRKAGIAISTAASIANNIQTLSEVSLGVATQAKLPFPANIIGMASTLATVVSLFANMASLGDMFGGGGVVDTFANGGMVNGKSHAQGGEKFAVGGRVVELEGGEAVINKRSTSMFRNQLSAMNSVGGGVKFADGGLLNQPSFSQQQFSALNNNQMMGAMGGSSKVVVVEADITESQNTVSVIQAQATI